MRVNCSLIKMVVKDGLGVAKKAFHKMYIIVVIRRGDIPVPRTVAYRK